MSNHDYLSTAGERRAALYLIDVVGLTDRETACILGRSERQIGTWRKQAGIPGKRGKLATLPPSAARWLKGLTGKEKQSA